MELHQTLRHTGPHTEPHIGARTGIKPPDPSPSFVFIDLREDPGAWVQIEKELAQDTRLTRH